MFYALLLAALTALFPNNQHFQSEYHLVWENATQTMSECVWEDPSMLQATPCVWLGGPNNEGTHYIIWNQYIATNTH
jgi:hypothetical protein